MEKLAKGLAKSKFGQSLINHEQFQRSSEWKEKQNKKYTENLANSLSKAAFQSSYLKSIVKVKEDEDRVLQDEDQ